MSLETIRNFIELDATYGTAGQPSEEQLQSVAQHGYQVVVNLGLLDPRYCLPDEAATVARLGLQYHHIPVDFLQPQLEDFLAFQATLLAARPNKVFVHCAANYRVSCFMSLFGERHLGWSAEQAAAHFRRLWEPNEVWTRFFEDARNAKPTRRHRHALRAPALVVSTGTCHARWSHRGTFNSLHRPELQEHSHCTVRRRRRGEARSP